MEPCQRIERRKQREDLSSTILSLSFSFPFLLIRTLYDANQKRERDNNEQLYEKVVRLVGREKETRKKNGERERNRLISVPTFWSVEVSSGGGRNEQRGRRIERKEGGGGSRLNRPQIAAKKVKVGRVG